MGHGSPLTFRLSRVAHGERNQIAGWAEAELQEKCRKAREVLLPGVDIATAYAMVNCELKGVIGFERLEAGDVVFLGAGSTGSAEDRQVAVDIVLAEAGFAVRMPEAWKHLHHVVRYFDLIEKNEAPDTSLLEWLISAGVVGSKIAVRTVRRFSKPSTLGRHAFVLHPDEAQRLTIAAEVREQLDAEVAAETK